MTRDLLDLPGDLAGGRVTLAGLLLLPLLLAGGCELNPEADYAYGTPQERAAADSTAEVAHPLSDAQGADAPPADTGGTENLDAKASDLGAWDVPETAGADAGDAGAGDAGAGDAGAGDVAEAGDLLDATGEDAGPGDGDAEDAQGDGVAASDALDGADSDASDAAAEVTGTAIDGGGGGCTASSDCPSPPGSPCLTASCDKASGQCGQAPVADGVLCDDGNACTGGDACAKGGCAGAPVVCDDGNACTAGSCDAAKGCVFAPKAGECDTGNPCTVDDACKDGVCKPGKAKSCDDGNPCTLQDTCAPGKGCTSTPAGEGSACGFNVVCIQGACVPDCSALPDGKACDDGDVCTKGEVCASGECTAGAARSLSTVAGGPGFADGPKGFGRLHDPHGIATGGPGLLWVADRNNHAVRRVSAGGLLRTIAGDGVPGDQDGKGASARFRWPHGVAVDAKGVGWVADTGNHRIRRVSADGTVQTIAGNKKGFADGKGFKAAFSSPHDVVVGAGGSLFVADFDNHAIRKIAPDGTVSTFAGGTKGSKDGVGSAASFWSPFGLAIDASGIVFVGDRDSARLRRIALDGQVTTIAGSTPGLLDGIGLKAKLSQIAGLAVDEEGNLWVADQGNHRVRRLGAAGVSCDDAKACTIDACDPKNGCWHVPAAKAAPCEDGKLCTTGESCDGKGSCVAGKAVVCVSPHACGSAACSELGGCTFAALAGGSACGAGHTCQAGDCVAVSCKGQPDASPCQPSSACVTLPACSAGTCKAAAGASVSTWAGDGAAGLGGGHRKAARLWWPATLAVTADGSVVFTDSGSARVRRVTPTGQVQTIAGSGVAGFADGEAHEAAFNAPWGIAIGTGGTLLVADSGNHRIRSVDSKGQVTTLAGGTAGYLDGQGSAARLHSPMALAPGPGGLIVADEGNRRVRMVSAAGVVSTVAGSGLAGHVDGPALQASFERPRGVDVDAKGVIYVADLDAHRIRRVGLDGMVTTVAGSGKTGFADGPAATAVIMSPSAVTVGPSGSLWVATERRIRRISPAGMVTTVAGSGSKGLSNGPPFKATFASPTDLRFDARGRLLIADRSNHVIRRLAWPSMTCDDGNPCTTESCDKSKGCVFQANTMPCGDGDPCLDAKCSAGKCKINVKSCAKHKVFAVTTTADSGPGSLREAMTKANLSGTADIVVFDIGTGPKTITLKSNLPVAVKPLTIDGTTQPGYGQANLIAIDAAATTGYALHIKGVATVKALTLIGASDGLKIEGAGATVVDRVVADGATPGKLLGTGIEISGGNGVKVLGSSARHRSKGIHVLNSADVTVKGNDVRGSGSENGSSHPAGVLLQSITANKLAGGLAVSGNLFDEKGKAHVALSGCKALVIRGKPEAGANVVLEEATGFGAATGTALYVGSSSNVDIAGLDVSWPHPKQQKGTGLRAASVVGLKIAGIQALHRAAGIHLNGNTDQTIVDNDLRGSGGCASNASGLTISGNKADKLPGGLLVSGNLFDAQGSCNVFVSGAKDLVIRGKAEPGAHVILQRAKGFGTGGGWGLRLFGGSNIDIAGLNVSGQDTKSKLGLGLDVRMVVGLKITGVVARNRSGGLRLEKNEGQTVTDNDLRDSGSCSSGSTALYAAYLDEKTAISGNLFGGSSPCQVYVGGSKSIAIGAKAGPGVQLALEPANGFGDASSTALRMAGCSQVTVKDLDVRRTGKAAGVGLKVDDCTDIKIIGLRASSRKTGLSISGGSGTQVSCSTFAYCTTGLSTNQAIGVVDSHFQGNATAVAGNAPTDVTAQKCYWGAASGSASTGGAGDKVSGKVDATSPATSKPICSPAL